MKKNAVTLAVTLLMGMNFATATENSSSTGEPSYFEILEDMIKDSAIPQVKDVLGNHAGRCFTASSPNLPYAGKIRFKQIFEDVGPLGDSYPKYGFMYGTNSQASYYDDMDESYFDFTTYYRYFATIGEGVESNSKEYEYKFGVDNDYILMEVIKGGAPILRCYYFLPGLGNNSSL